MLPCASLWAEKGGWVQCWANTGEYTCTVHRTGFYLGEHGDHICVRVEDNRAEAGVLSLPGQDHDGLTRDALVGEVGETQVLCVAEKLLCQESKHS